MDTVAAHTFNMPPPRTPTSSQRQAVSTRSRESSHQAGSSQIVPQSPSIISRTQSTSAGITPVLVYQHIRSLNGIIRSIERQPDIPTDDDETIPKFGPATDSYLTTHGYSVGAISRIEHAVETYKTSQAFINYLHSRGMPWREAEYLWGLLERDSE